MIPDPLRANCDEVRILSAFIGEAARAKDVPEAFIRVMERGSWQVWRNELGREVRPHDFREFVEAKYPSGIGTTLDVLHKLIAGNPKAVDLYDQAMQQKPGGQPDNKNAAKADKIQTNASIIKVRSVLPAGTTEAYALRKLRKDKSEIHTRVIKGELSPHAGMIEAGFRKRMIQLPLDREKWVKAIRKHFSEADQRWIGYWLTR